MFGWHHLHSRGRALMFAFVDAAVCVTGATVLLLVVYTFEAGDGEGMPSLYWPAFVRLLLLIAAMSFVPSYLALRTVQKRPELVTNWRRRLTTTTIGVVLVTSATWVFLAWYRDTTLSVWSWLQDMAVFGGAVAPLCYRLACYRRDRQLELEDTDEVASEDLRGSVASSAVASEPPAGQSS